MGKPIQYRAGAVVLLLGLAAGATPAGAHGHGSGFATLASGSATAASRAADFDWSNPRGQREVAQAVSSAPRVPMRVTGRASWVCSPAGFGRPSRCTSR
jgi:hypothetical protein